ncbi:MAG: type II secretion system protein [Myxococcales bacterium]|nr:type II secretion system protein [Myxococcales bacterium]MCB9547062.1 type II secretion system protein [Myxococcales bacterium]
MNRRRRVRGFSMVEVLLVTVLMGIIAALAYPALRTFSGRDADANAATSVARLVNRVKDQARRRNRAYVIQLTQLAVNRPQGLVTIRESSRSSCMLTVLAQTRVLQQVPYGQVVIPDYGGDQETEVGLFGWTLDDGANVAQGDLTLCVSPNGALAIDIGDAAVALSGRLDLLVQRFAPAGGAWTLEGPPRRVELTYGGGARLELIR